MNGIIASVFQAKPSIMNQIQNAEMNRNLTEREMQVAMACCKGKSSRIIADELGLSKRTFDSHKTNIYRKLGINNKLH